MSEEILRHLGVREQDLMQLSVCSADKASIEKWLNKLPTAHVGAMSKNLFAISGELYRLKIDAESRLGMLETLLPKVLDTNRLLSKHYLNQPVILSPKAQRVVELSHSMWLNFANAYTRVAVELSQSKSGLLRRPNKALIGKAIARGISILTQDLLVCYQLYVSPPKTVWIKLHYLYQIATSLGIENVSTVGDDLRKSRAIRDLYAHAMLLGCIKANQLRQSDLAIVNTLLPKWAQRVSIEAYEHGNVPSLFAINTKIDRSPVYAHLLSEANLKDCTLQISTTELVEHLRESLDDQAEGNTQIDDTRVGADLLSHLLMAWGKCSKRSFMRMDSNSKLEISFGLESAHFFASGEQSFDAMVAKVNEKMALQATIIATPFDDSNVLTPSSWEKQNRAGGLENMETIDYGNYTDLPSDRNNNSNQHTTTIVGVNNASPGGYSICMPGTQNGRVHAGDLIAVREENAKHWSIAAVRWLHRPNKTELNFGVELISPAYIPSVARITHSESKPEEYHPILMLPEISVTNQPNSILVRSNYFEEEQTLQLLERDELKNIRILEQISKTRMYTQYSYTTFEAANDAIPDDSEEFDELWSNL